MPLLSPEDVRLRCELCQTEMSCESPAGGAVRYHHCSRCGRWVASNYGEELVRAHTARPAGVPAPGPAGGDLDRIKAKLARWLEDLDERDPYFVLGVSPRDPEEKVRARFHELALAHHPDHGGDPAQMRRFIAAYDRIRRGKRLGASPTPRPVAPATAAPAPAVRPAAARRRA